MDNETSFFYFIVLGIVQGLTEVLPISSSGHLALAQKLLNVDMLTLASAAALHGGSLLAIAWWFRRDFLALWRSFQASRTYWRNPRQLFSGPTNEYRVPYFIGLSLIPVAIEGVLLKPWADSLFLAQATWVPLLLIFNGFVILATAWLTRGEKRLDELTGKEYLLIGFIQGFAVLPGISRLGLALCAGLWRGLNWYEALRLTFILAVPTIIGAIIWQIPPSLQGVTLNTLVLFAPKIFGLLLSTLLVMITSLVGLYKLTGSLLERRTLDFFGYYCCLLGMFAFTYIVVGF